ncbi:TerB family tellurite resistance protein [Pseudoduganella sp.]|uniref:tellurite resistance TerB family protein n=1 Tax=Pseudoduganella sp. TaxID=1880898 RepID=UPI0035AEDC46
MKSYVIDGPQAMSRILALTMIVDGHVSPSELSALRNAPFLEQVGVDADTFDCTMRELCEDLLLAVPNRNAGLVEINPALLDEVLAEIQDPVLQMCLLKAMLDIVYADGMLDSRETVLVRRAARRWTHVIH